MLASLLPGLRDLRTPLATGYLWLIGLWLLLHNHLPKNVEEAKGPIKSLYQLGALMGPASVLAAVSFGAYLLGSLLMANLELAPTAFVRPRRRIFSRLPRTYFSRGDRLYFQLLSFVQRRMKEKPPPPESRRTFDYYVDGIIADLPAVGIQLQAKNRDFWDTYDRQKAEAQFRFGIAPPIVLIIILVAVESWNAWWLLLLVVPFYLLMLGRYVSTLAIAALVQAVVLKMVEPPTFERLAVDMIDEREVLKDTGPIPWVRPNEP